MEKPKRNSPVTQEEIDFFFKSRVNVNSETGCWEWKIQQRGGYGRINTSNRLFKHTGEAWAHRASYKAYNGDIPEDHVVRHMCNKSLCCNPEHLTIGTQRQNLADKYAKLSEMDTSGLLVLREKIKSELDQVNAEIAKRS